MSSKFPRVLPEYDYMDAIADDIISFLASYEDFDGIHYVVSQDDGLDADAGVNITKSITSIQSTKTQETISLSFQFYEQEHRNDDNRVAKSIKKRAEFFYNYILKLYANTLDIPNNKNDKIEVSFLLPDDNNFRSLAFGRDTDGKDAVFGEFWLNVLKRPDYIFQDDKWSCT